MVSYNLYVKIVEFFRPILLQKLRCCVFIYPSYLNQVFDKFVLLPSVLPNFTHDESRSRNTLKQQFTLNARLGMASLQNILQYKFFTGTLDFVTYKKYVLHASMLVK